MVFAGDLSYNTNNVYGGITSNLRATYFHPFAGGLGGVPWIGSVGVGLFFASDHFADRYFGVRGSDLALFPERGGVPYRPDGGLTSVKIPFTLSAQVNPQWMIMFAGRYEKMLNDAKDSPIIERHGDENQWTLGVAATYTF